jgi:hypothetical protein
MSNKPAHRNNQGLQVPLDPDLIHRLLENQARELALRERELLIQQQQAQNGHQYAQLALNAQAEDRKQIREHNKIHRRERLYFATFISILITGFVIYALQIGKDAIAIEVLKALVYLLAGGAGGYSLRGSEKSKVAGSKAPPVETKNDD